MNTSKHTHTSITNVSTRLRLRPPIIAPNLTGLTGFLHVRGCEDPNQPTLQSNHVAPLSLCVLRLCVCVTVRSSFEKSPRL